MSRTGRPLKADSLRKNQVVRLSEEERQLLEECATTLGITKTDVIVKGIHLVHQSLGDKK